jgi:hypothetical protein
MAKAPTDLQILNAIYERHYADFAQFSDTHPTRKTKNYVPIDTKQIAADLGVDADIVFGRLYYDLEKRFGYKQHDGSLVHFFALRIGEEKHLVHFPYLASVVSNLRSERRRNVTATVIASISLIVSIISIVIAVRGS